MPARNWRGHLNTIFVFRPLQSQLCGRPVGLECLLRQLALELLWVVRTVSAPAVFNFTLQNNPHQIWWDYLGDGAIQRLDGAGCMLTVDLDSRSLPSGHHPQANNGHPYPEDEQREGWEHHRTSSIATGIITPLVLRLRANKRQ